MIFLIQALPTLVRILLFKKNSPYQLFGFSERQDKGLSLPFHNCQNTELESWQSLYNDLFFEVLET